MAKKDIIEPQGETIIVNGLDQIVSDRFGRYAKYIIQDRALPDVRDGLKPVQRRILYAMHELGLFYNKPYKKSARVVGEVIGKYHPHGDSSIYEAMIRMAQDWKMNMPLIQVHGNKGSIDDDPAAAMRYTESRLSEIAQYLIDGIKKDTVGFAPNFDDSEQEPIVLPGLIPNLLVNGTVGIAAGYATEMPPHNLGEIIDAIDYKLKNQDANINDIMQFVKGPDFPTGGIVLGEDGIYSAFEKGRGRIAIRAKYEFVLKSKTEAQLIITEIPYGVVKQRLVKSIDDIIFERKIAGLNEIRDESDRNGISIAIDVDANIEVDKVMDYLYSRTELQVYYNYNNVSIKDRAPRVMGILEIIDAYIAHQRKVQVKSITFDMDRDVNRHEIVVGLIKASKIVDKIIDAIKNVTGSKMAVVDKLISTFDFTKRQAEAIADLRLYRLSRTDQELYLEEKAALETKIAWAQKVLGSTEELNNHIISLLKDVKEKFAIPRRTTIVKEFEVKKIDLEQLIRHEDMWIAITRQGYIKRFSDKIVMSNDITKVELKERDIIVYFKKINTADKVLIFTNQGRYFTIPGHKIVETKWKEIGKHINDHAEMDKEEVVVDVISVSSFNLNAFITLMTREGKGKRTRLADFEMQKYSRAGIAMVLTMQDKLIGASVSDGTMNVVAVSESGFAVNYPETQLSVQGTRSGGVKAFGIADTDRVSGFTTCLTNQQIGLVSARGGVKRIKVSNILPSGKNTSGKPLYKTIKGNPHYVIDCKVVLPSTRILWSFEDKPIESTDFKPVPPTYNQEGFSLTNNFNIVDCSIFSYPRVDEDYFDVISVIDENGQIQSRTQEISAKAFKNIESAQVKGAITPPPARKTMEETFKEAEDTLEKFSQISIDDIIKGIK